MRIPAPDRRSRADAAAAGRARPAVVPGFRRTRGPIYGRVGGRPGRHPTLFALIGVRAIFVVAGAFLPVLFLLLSRRLAEVDASGTVPETRLALLRSLPIFSPLPAPAIERVASRLIPMEATAGMPIVRQGEPGDRFYIIADGEVTVSKDDRSVASLGGGGFFGEIALLRDAPRNASVTARTWVRLYDAFLNLSGYLSRLLHGCCTAGVLIIRTWRRDYVTFESVL